MKSKKFDYYTKLHTGETPEKAAIREALKSRGCYTLEICMELSIIYALLCQELEEKQEVAY